VLDWNDNNEIDLAGYNIYRSIISGSGYGKLNGLLVSDSNYTDTDVSTGTTYYYVVTAVNTGSNESGYSGEVTAVPSNPAAGTGAVLYEYWAGIPGAAVSDLTSDVNYPDNSSGRELIMKLQGPVNWTDNYGTSIRGYLNPVTAGGYTFWIAGDDSGELWLSTDDNPDNAVLIASVPVSPQSSLISLAAGQKYYIEVLHKEDAGNDNISVSWQGPALAQQVIDGIYLSPCCLEFRDFSDFASQWQRVDCSAGNDWCEVADLNRDGSVLFDDFKVFADTWLLGI
jgi:hypothetical protein